MHDTAFHIGTLAMNIYADLRTDSILEIGSKAVNGSLRQLALPSTRYIGVDIEEGEGVDLVVEAGKPLPVEGDSFDFVVASSVFEHDPCFWMTFLEMCRAAKAGGYIYINAPSNGVVHRFPQDNWRFYPDSGLALAQWAVSQGQHVSLVESFVARREKDIWNDFVAVYRKGPITKLLPKVFIHEHLECSDVITWKSNEVLNPSDKTEDVILLDEAKDRAKTAEEQLHQVTSDRELLEAEMGRLRALLSEAEQQRQGQLEEANKARADLSQRDSELRQRQEEIEQTRAELLIVRAQQSESAEEIKRRQTEIEQTSAELITVRAEFNDRADQLKRGRDELDRTRGELSIVRGELSASKAQVEVEKRLRRDVELALADLQDLYAQEQARSAELARREQALAAQAEKLEFQIESMDLQLQAARKDLLTADEDMARSSARVDDLSAEKAVLESRLNDRFREIARMSELLVDAEANERGSREQLEWLCEAGTILLNGSRSRKRRLLSILPSFVEARRRRRALKDRGLFDEDAYVAVNPDVKAAGVDPLQHYLKHGLSEKRRRF